MDTAKPIMTPVEEKLRLTKKGSGGYVNPTYFISLAGSLIYLMSTRPDINFAVGLINRFMENPRQSHVGSQEDFELYWSSGVFSWSSKKQQVIASSTVETEYIATANSATQALWLRLILGVLQYKQVDPMKIYCDSKSAIELSKNPVLHGHSKHIDIKYHFIRELIQERKIEIDYCRTEEQVADIFTKALKAETFVKLKKMLGMAKLEKLGVREAM